MTDKLKDYANKVLRIDPLSSRLHDVGFTGGAGKRLSKIKDRKKEKIKKERLKAAGVAALGAVGVSAAVKNIKKTLESEYGKEDKKE